MISAHVLVKNEDRFIWYSVMSIINYVDRVRLWDTGSTDKTLEIIDEMMKTPIGKKKIFFEKWQGETFDEQKVRQDMLNEFRDVREGMLKATIAHWIVVVDADEIWWDNSISGLIREIKQNAFKLESIVVPNINLVGDMFHYQEKEAGKYNLLGLKGHYALRAMNTWIPGLKSLGGHGVWGWADSNDEMIQDRNQNKMKFVNTPYLHATHLQRSGDRSKDLLVLKRGHKRKHELGIPFPKDFYYPEVFFRERPAIVPNIWENMSFGFKFRAFFETPLRKINRRYLPEKIGY